MENQQAIEIPAQSSNENGSAGGQAIAVTKPAAGESPVLDVRDAQVIDLRSLPVEGTVFHKDGNDLVVELAGQFRIVLTGFFDTEGQSGKILEGSGWQLDGLELQQALEENDDAFSLAEGTRQTSANANSVITEFDGNVADLETVDINRLQLSSLPEPDREPFEVPEERLSTEIEEDAGGSGAGDAGTGVPDEENAAPVAEDVTATTPEGESLIVAAEASDGDGDALTYAVDTSGTLGTVTNNGDGTFTYNPNGQFESLAVGETAQDTFTYTVSDGNGGIDTATVTVTVEGENDAPVAVDDTPALTVEHTAAAVKLAADDGTQVFLYGNWSAASADGSTIVLAAPWSDGEESDTGAVYVFDSNGNQITILTASDAQETDVFGTSAAVSADGSVIVVGAAGEDGNEDETGAVYVYRLGDGGSYFETKLTLEDGQEYDYLGASVAVSADGSTVIASDLGDEGAIHVFTLQTDGSYSQTELTADYVDDDDYFGHSVAVSADGSAIVAGAPYNEYGNVSGAVYVYRLESDGSYSQTRLTASDVSAGGVLGFSVAISPDGSTIVAGAPGGLVNGEQTGTVYIYTLQGDGSYSETVLAANDGAAQDFFGLSVAVSADGSAIVVGAPGDDGNGNAPGSVYVFDAEGNQIAKLTASDDALYDVFGSPLSVSADGAVISIGIWAGDEGSLQTFVRNEDGDYVGPDGTVYDENGATLETADTSIVLAVEETSAVGENETATIDTADLLENDSDPDGDDLTVTAVSATSEMGATVTLIDRDGDGVYDEVDYDPTGSGELQALGAGETVEDTFTYQISDGNGGTDTATVTVTVEGENDAPVAEDVAATVSENGSLVVAAGASDVDGDALTYSVGATGTLGTVTNNGDGTFSYDPNGQFESLAVGETAEDTFTYTVTDGNGGTDTATVTVTVTGENDAPVAVDDQAAGDDTSEFLVNTETLYFQTAPTIATLAGGGFVIVWQSDDGEDDTSDNGIKAQIFDSGGNAAGWEILVNSVTDEDQRRPSVTALSGGGFVVTWQSNDGQDDPSGYGIKARIFDADGTAAGEEFLVNSVTDDYQLYSSITALSGGGFVVTWESYDGQDDPSGYGIKARIFDADGTAAGEEFLVNSVTVGNQYTPSITALSGGGFVVTWDSSDDQDDSSGYGIKARIFEEDGTAAGEEFLVNSVTDDDQYSSSITALADGGFVIVWQSYDGQDDSSGGGIKARIFDADGTAVGDEFLVNSVTRLAQILPSITALSGGGFVVTWASGDGQDDPSSSGIKARIFDADGTAIGDEFLINSVTENAQSRPSITALADGGFVVTWESGDGQEDTSQSSIKARIFDAEGNPVAVTGIATDEDTVLSRDTAVLLANDSDPDGDALTVTEVSATSELGASVTLIDTDGNGVYDRVDYDPTGSEDFQALGAGETVEDTFTYTISDGHGGTDTATVTVVVEGVNDAPVAVDDTPVLAVSPVPTAAKLTADDGAVRDTFGKSVAISADGSTIAIGAIGEGDTYNASGSVYLFDEEGNQIAKLTAEDGTDFAFLGGSVAISADGSTIVAGASGDDDNGTFSGSVYVFDAEGNQIAKLTADDGEASDFFGSSVAISADGSTIVVGAEDKESGFGAVYVFDAVGNLIAKPVPEDAEAGDKFGTSVAVSADGSTIVVGAQTGDSDEDDTGAVYVFDADGNQIAKLTAEDGAAGEQFGYSVAVSADGSTIIVGALDGLDDDGDETGAVYVYTADGSGGYTEMKLVASDGTGSDEFGSFVAMSADGSTFVVSAPNNNNNALDDGAVYVFDAEGNQIAKLTAYDGKSRDGLGSVSVSGDGSMIVVGAAGERDAKAGAAYTFIRNEDGDYVGADGTVYDENGPTGETVDPSLGLEEALVVGEDQTATIDTADLLENDTDPEGDALTVIAVDATSDLGATVTLIDTDGDGIYDQVGYDPSGSDELQALGAGETVEDTFTYTVSDGNGGTDTAEVTVTVEGANDNPVAVDDLLVRDETAVSEFLVNTITANDQEEPSIAALAGGGYVIVWESEDDQDDGSGNGIKAQIYDAYGTAVGAEFLVNTRTNDDQNSPSITALADGGFVIAWDSYDGQDDTSRSSIKARIFDADGTAVGEEFLVNSVTEFSQGDPVVTALAGGGFVVTWESNDRQDDAFLYGVKARIYNTDGTAVGEEFLVNTVTEADQLNSSVTALAGGGFVIAWESYDGQDDTSNASVKAQIFDADGTAVGEEFLVNTETNSHQSRPSITALADGGFVIAWWSLDGQDDTSGSGIKAQIYDADGTAVGEEFLVNSETESSQRDPVVTALAGGGFVVTWKSSDGQDDTSETGIKAQIFDADGNAVGEEFLVNTVTDDSQGDPAVTALADGGFVVTWESEDELADDDGSSIKAAMFDAEGNPYSYSELATDEGTALQIDTADLLENDSDPDGDALTITAVKTTSEMGATVTLIDSDDDGVYDEIDYDPTGSDELQALGAGETVEDSFTYQISDGNGGTDIADVTLTVTGVNDAPVAVDDVFAGDEITVSEFLVNTEQSDAQSYPVIATLAGGGYVIVWQSADDTSVNDIKAQIYDAYGNATGEEFLVNTETSNSQSLPSITALADGGFVVTWESYDGQVDTSETGIKARIFDANGDAADVEFPVNSVTDESQIDSSVTALAGGGFVVIWQSYDGQVDTSESGIKARIFDADGTAAGDEFLVNTETDGSQYSPTVTELADGGFVVTWISREGSSTYKGTIARIFEADGTPASGEVLVNSETSFAQYSLGVTALAGGGFVVTWESDNTQGDTSISSIQARIFDADGTPASDEFQINSEEFQLQGSPSVTALAGGGFVVTWYSFDGKEDESESGIKARIFAADGTAAGDEFLINTETDGAQSLPAVTALADGGFAVTWESEDDDGSGIKAAMFDAEGNPYSYYEPITDEDSVFEIDTADLLENDTDADGDELTVTAVDATSALGATVTLIDNDGDNVFDEIEYDPTGSDEIQALGEGEIVEDTFTYTVSDENGGTDTAVVTVVVGGVNDDPVAADDMPVLTVELTAAAAKLTASDGAENDGFGTSTVVSADGTTIVVAAPLSDNDNGNRSGSVYVFDAEGNQIAKLTADDGADDDAFGWSVAVSADGSTIVVGAVTDDDNGNASGSAYVFDADGNQLAKLTADDGSNYDTFGNSIAVSEDGSVIVVGAYQDDVAGNNSGSAYVFDAEGNQLAKLQPDDPESSSLFGASVGISADGSVIVVGASTKGSGAVYLFDAGGNQIAKLTSDDAYEASRFGSEVAVSANGTIVISAHGDNENGLYSGSAYIFDVDGNEIAKLTASDGQASDVFGGAVAISMDGSTIVVGAAGDDDNGSSSGSVYVFDADGNQVAKLTAADGEANDYFGASVSVSWDGAVIVVGSYGDDELAGAAYTFVRNEDGFYVGSDGTVYGESGPSQEISDTSVLLMQELASEDGTATIDTADLLENDTDAEGDELTVTAVDALSALGATVTLIDNDNDGVYDDIEYDPTGSDEISALGAGETAEDTFTYTVSDGNGGEDTAEVTVTVEGVNDAPVAVDDTLALAVSEDETATVATADLLDDDTDAEGDALTVLAVETTSALGATVTLIDSDGDGVYDEVGYDPTGSETLQALAEGETAEDSFTYTVFDGNGGTDTAEVTLTVEGVNDAPVAVDDLLLGDEVTEFLVSSETIVDQTKPSITVLTGGGFVITWESQYSADDASGYAVKAQVYSADGLAIGEEFLVNTATTGAQQAPSITALADGGFVVAWQSADGGDDDSGTGIKAQIFDARGAAVGNEFLVNTETTDSQTVPSITALDDGGFVVAWQGYDASGSGIKAQIYNSDGEAVDGEISVNTETTGEQLAPSIEALDGGGFVVTWQSDNGLTDQDGRSGFDIKARIYNASGEAVGDDFVVNTGYSGEQTAVSVAGLVGGGFVVTWESDEDQVDTSSSSIKAQIFDASGNPVEDEFLVNTATNGPQKVPSIVTLAGGGFVIVWQSWDGGADTSGNGIKAQIFDADGTAVGDEFLVNERTVSSQKAPDVAALADGGFVVTFQSWDADNGSSGEDIVARRFDAEGNPVSYFEPLTDEDTAIQIDMADLLDNDTDAEGDDLTITTVSATSNLGAEVALIDSDGDGTVDQVEYDPSGSRTLQMLSEGETLEDSFTYTVSDGNGGTDTAEVTLTVEGAGTFSSTSSGEIDAGSYSDFYDGFDQTFSYDVNDDWTTAVYLTFDGQADFDHVTETIDFEISYSYYDAETDTYGTVDAQEVSVDFSSSYVTDYTGDISSEPDEFEIQFAISGAGVTEVDNASNSNYFISDVEVRVTTDGVDNLGGDPEISSTYSYDYLIESDPLAFDLNGDGSYFITPSEDFAFEIDGGVASAWTSPEDGLLAVDLDGSGAIEDGTELFSLAFGGGHFSSGLEALASYDSNGDGLISAADENFSEISLWVDADSDGITDAGELLGLADHGIAEIDLSAFAVDEAVDGVQVASHGTATTESGGTVEFVEFGFNADVAGPSETLAADAATAVNEVTAIALAG